MSTSKNDLENLATTDDYDILLCQTTNPSQISSIENYEMYPIVKDSIVVICSKSSEFAQKRFISSVTLSKEPLVFFSVAPLDEIWVYRKVFRERGLFPKNISQINIESSYFKKIQDGDLSLYSKMAIKKGAYQKKYNISFVPLKEKLEFYYVLLINKEAQNKQQKTILSECIIDILTNNA